MATYLHLAGVVAHRAGESASAVEYLREAAEIRNLMRDPRTVGANEAYAHSCIELADAQCSLGRLEDAAKSSEQACAAMSAVASARPDKAFVLEYGRVLLRAGDLQRRAGVTEAAIKSYETAASLAIHGEGLGGVAIQRLVVCLRRSGYAEEAQVWAAKLSDRES
jgi:tetratricopeptide (TPR) repeat protein